MADEVTARVATPTIGIGANAGCDGQIMVVDDMLDLFTASLEINAIYVPDGDQMYPDGFATNVSLSGLTDMLCGAARPGHFDGVATVVSKLFLQTQADQAWVIGLTMMMGQVLDRVAEVFAI